MADGTEKKIVPGDLKIILYPDPRLKKVSRPIEVFDDWLGAVAARMMDLMHQAKGVGLAAPQVGLNLRLFVINPSGKPEDDKAYVNPTLTEAEAEEEAEEGCLSLPGININVWRSKKLQMQAQNLAGQPFTEIGEGYIPRIWQHETDHLNGTLLLDRMGPVARMTHRKQIKELEQRWKDENGK